MPRTIDLRKKNAKLQVYSPAKTGPVLTVSPAALPRKFFWETTLWQNNSGKKYAFAVIAGLLSGAGAIIFFNKNLLTAIFMIISAAVLTLYTNKKPSVSQISINESGISIDGQPYAYKELKSFWLQYTPGDAKELSLESKKWYLPYIKINIENQNPMELRAMLSNFIPEKEHEISLIDIIGKKIGL